MNVRFTPPRFVDNQLANKKTTRVLEAAFGVEWAADYMTRWVGVGVGVGVGGWWGGADTSVYVCVLIHVIVFFALCVEWVAAYM